MTNPRPPVFSQPIRQVASMLIALGLVAGGGWMAQSILRGIFASGHVLSTAITAVFVLGIVTCFWQVWQLVQAVRWIDGYVQDRPGTTAKPAPSMLASLAALLGPRAAQMQIPSSSAQSILDSVAQRIDEGRDITRYLTNLLIFLGLLGTFFGLATTVPAIVDTIRSLAPQDGESSVDIFGRLMTGLEAQLGGMGTAFSSSLLGLAGSLVVGLLELFASHGQNRFYRELEEWVSSITRVGFSGEGEGGDITVLAQVLDGLALQIEGLQQAYAQSDVSLSIADERLADVAAAVTRLTDRLDRQSGTETALLTRIAEGQDRLLIALGSESSGPHADAESRMRLRSIDVQLLRILEEISAGRQESIADLRTDLAGLTQAIRQATRGRG